MPANPFMLTFPYRENFSMKYAIGNEKTNMPKR